VGQMDGGTGRRRLYVVMAAGYVGPTVGQRGRAALVAPRRKGTAGGLTY